MLRQNSLHPLGFDPRGVRILLNSHAHYDHAGGLAAQKEATAALLYAGRGDSALLARGGKEGFFFHDRFPFPPMIVGRLWAEASLGRHPATGRANVFASIQRYATVRC